MEIEYSSKGGLAYTFYKDEKIIIAELIKKHIPKVTKKIIRLEDKLDGRANIIMKYESLVGYKQRLENIISEFEK